MLSTKELDTSTNEFKSSNQHFSARELSKQAQACRATLPSWNPLTALQDRRVVELGNEVRDLHKEVDRMRNARSLTQVSIQRRISIATSIEPPNQVHTHTHKHTRTHTRTHTHTQTRTTQAHTHWSSILSWACHQCVQGKCFLKATKKGKTLCALLE